MRAGQQDSPPNPAHLQAPTAPPCLLQDGGSAGVADSGSQQPWEARAFALMKEAKWFEAQQFLAAQAKAAAEGPQQQGAGQLGGGALGASLALCNAKLGLPSTQAAAPSTRGSSVHPLQHLSAALAGPSQGGSPAPSAAAARVQQRQDDAQVVGQALAFLLHPATAQLPASLAQEALQVLEDRAARLSAGAAAAQTSGAGPSPSAAAQRTGFEQRAQGSKALSQLVGMVGLQPVKEQLLSLADQVRGSSVGSCQLLACITCLPTCASTPACALLAPCLPRWRWTGSAAATSPARTTTANLPATPALARQWWRGRTPSCWRSSRRAAVGAGWRR